jgi:hypothetical protein
LLVSYLNSNLFAFKPSSYDITLVLEAEKDDSFPGQPKKVYDALTSAKSYIKFTEEEGAEEHCQGGAPALSNQRIFDWLDETLNNV